MTKTELAHFDEEWLPAYKELVESRKYQKAELSDQASMIDDLKSDVAKETKKWMARQLRFAGVRLGKKE